MKTFLMTSAATLLIAGTAFAQGAYDPSQVDADHNGTIDRNEFNAAYGNDAFGKWDTNNDGKLSRDEYQAGVETWGDQDMGNLYDPWASNDLNEPLTADNFENGLWTHYDLNKNGTLEPAEAKAWDEYQLRYDATRSGREVSQ